jgi:hypothetical protein
VMDMRTRIEISALKTFDDTWALNFRERDGHLYCLDQPSIISRWQAFLRASRSRFQFLLTRSHSKRRNGSGRRNIFDATLDSHSTLRCTAALPRMLSATRKRHAHWLANQAATSIQNEAGEPIQNEKPQNEESA